MRFADLALSGTVVECPEIVNARETDSGLNLVSEWPDLAMYRYAGGYRRAALAVYQSAVASPDPPFSVWPLAFLWRHHVELALKWLIANGRVDW